MQEGSGPIILVLVIVLVIYLYRRRQWQPSGTAHGTACWADRLTLVRNGFLSSVGLVLGRTLRNKEVIRLPTYTHLSVTAPTGAGKGVSFVIPTLLTYTKGSVFVNDPKGELYKLTAANRRVLGNRVIRIDPFRVCGPGGDSLNVLTLIQDSDLLIDDARACAEALVIRAPEGDKDPFWNNSAVNLLTGLLVATTLLMGDEDRNLSSLREMLTDPVIFKKVIAKLQAIGGIPGRLGNMIAKQSESEKESAGVISTANSHTSFLDSPLIAAAVNTSSFSADVLLEPGTTIYFVLPIEMLDSHKNFLRLMVSALLRHVMRHGVKNGGECLFLLDECASLSGLDALAQAFQLGRGKGVKLYTFWQSVDQQQRAFQGKPNLVADNSDAQVFFAVNGYPTAELVSKSLGQWTMVTESGNTSTSRSHSTGSQQGGGQWSRSESMNYAEHGRSLLDPAEIMRLPGEYLVALVRGCRPIIARRVFYYADKLFRTRRTSDGWWLLMLIPIALLIWGLWPQ